jgi:uncharacterized membrane protein YecN with MAPEG domain
MAWVALITVLSLFVYLGTLVNVGRARGKYGVAAPAMTGPEGFERAVRVQANTLEGMALYLPALWLFEVYVSPRYAAALGAVWIVGRVLYAIGYSRAAQQRSTGFLVQGVATLLLLLGALVGVLLALIGGRG